MPSPSLLAIVCARDEALQIRRCLAGLIAEGFEVVLLDHGSTDATRSIAEDFLGQGLIRIETLPWTGSFSLSDQLRAKQAIVETSRHDWVSHFDADELPVAAPMFERVIDAVAAAAEQNCNCINFHELVFLPPPGRERFGAPEFCGDHLDYYFFQPTYPRLMRIWRRDSGLSNLAAGGHQLRGVERRLFPVDLVLRHFIVLSRAAARAKYLPRVFSEEDLARGWHGNRVNIQAEAIDAYFDGRLARADRIHSLRDPDDHRYELSHPQIKHFWEWG